MNRTNFTYLLTLILLVICQKGLSQPFRTVTFTGDAYNDFNANERKNSSGSLFYEMTWDATKLYLGVSALFSYAKDEPTIYYIDTDPQTNPTAGTGTTIGFNNYDGRIGSLPFTANVVIYLKNGYCEMRKYSAGAWSGPTNFTSNTFFGTNDAEVSIPWTDFPSGTRPSAFRYMMFKENGSNGTDAYDIYPTGGVYIPNINLTPFASNAFIDIFDSSNGKTANTLLGTCPEVVIQGGACLGDGYAAFKIKPYLGCTFSITIKETTTNLSYTYNNVDATSSFLSGSELFYAFTNIPGTNYTLPVGTYQITNVTTSVCTPTYSAPCTGFTFSGSAIVEGTNSSPNIDSLTNSTTISGNGKILLNNLVPNRVYSKVTYDFNNNTITINNLTASANGKLTILNLAAGTYTDIKVFDGFCPSGTNTATLTGPTCTPNVGTFPWDGN